MGLLDAHAKFDPRKGVKFETYAVWRIKGAVLDQLRALDWVSRSMRRKARNLDGITRKLDQKLGRAATEEEVAREMKLSRGDFYRLLDHVRGAVLVSLDESRSGEDQEPRRSPTTCRIPNALDIEARLEMEQSRDVMLRTLDQLPEQERLVVSLYYYEHLTLSEIGRALGISESRVSQVHTPRHDASPPPPPEGADGGARDAMTTERDASRPSPLERRQDARPRRAGRRRHPTILERPSERRRASRSLWAACEALLSAADPRALNRAARSAARGVRLRRRRDPRARTVGQAGPVVRAGEWRTAAATCAIA